ncbi:MAG: sodium:solute symporter family protein [Phycisphaerae bacterium]
MQLTQLDWTIVILSLVVSFSPVIFYARRAGRGAEEFFASGRAAPWWLIGTSMVATTFSTDTPNLVTDFVRTGGVAKNWLWWAFLLTGMTTVFFFARLWRRSRVLTDLEFYELRYAGPAAAFLRAFRAFYLGLFFNCFIMATVTLAAVKIANVMLGWDRVTTVCVCGAICVLFGSISGLWGVLTTDLLQFVIAMIGVIAAAVVAVQQPQVGGLSGLFEKLGTLHPEKLSIIPPLTVTDAFGVTTTNWHALVPLLILPLLVQWWSVWYPGAEPGGGSYIAQRMLAARSERDALAGTLWFNVAHYAIRPWPWIIVALCSLLVFPTLDDIHRALPHVDEKLIGHDLAYPAMLTLLPHGLLGLLVSSLLAAYVSTMTTHMNWGTSYLVMDFFRRFVNPGASQREIVWLGRVVSALLMAVSGLLVFGLDTAGKSFQLLLSIGAGTGSIYLLRWYWWRINAWSEISAMITSFAASMVLFIAPRFGWNIPDYAALLITVLSTTIVWVTITLKTPPEKRETLIHFCQVVRPAGAGWNRIREVASIPHSPDNLASELLACFLGCTTVYSALFGVGGLLYGHLGTAITCGALLCGSSLGLWRLLAKLWRDAEADSSAC